MKELFCATCEVSQTFEPYTGDEKPGYRCDLFQCPACKMLVDVPNKSDEEPDNAFWWVGLYLTDKAFGGREEGGWWYDCGSLAVDRWLIDLGFVPSCHRTLTEAQAARDRMREAIEAHNLNEGRPPISSVCSQGIYDALILDADTLPAGYPDRRPRYE